MIKVLVVHGEGMDMRGKTQIDVFGTMTLPEYDEHIRRYATELGMQVEIFHSNVESEVIDKFKAADAQGFDAAIFNPAGFMAGRPALIQAISKLRMPTVEVHISNPARREKFSQIAAVARSVVTGFGVFGYYLALRGLQKELSHAS
jgi:3-dehydroquinate dehydratase-2